MAILTKSEDVGKQISTGKWLTILENNCESILSGIVNIIIILRVHKLTKWH